MKKTILNKEDKKYSELWQNNYKDANWKRLAKRLIKKISPMNNPSIIDFGFGTANAMKFFENKGFKTYGIEISSYAVKKAQEQGYSIFHSSLDNLEELKNKQFNVGFCNDVIEHIPEEFVKKSLSEMARVCSDYLFISVCPTFSNHRSLDGEQLHLTVRPKKWWEQQLKELGKIQEIKLLFSRSLRYIIKL